MIAMLRQGIFECCRGVIVDDHLDREGAEQVKTTHVEFNEPVSQFIDGGVLEPILQLCLKP